MIDESEMNRIIGVTSSSPAYVFKFIDAICEGARVQGIDGEGLLETICDMVIGSAYLLKNSEFSPKELISRVASKGGTTEKALLNYVETKISLDEIYSKYIKKGEIPFTSEKKMMSITYINSGEEITFIKGAYEVIEERCNKIYYNGQIIEFFD